MSRKKQITAFVDPDQYEELKEIRFRNGIPLAEMVRRGIDLAIGDVQERKELEKIGYDIKYGSDKVVGDGVQSRN